MNDYVFTGSICTDTSKQVKVHTDARLAGKLRLLVPPSRHPAGLRVA